jgi:large-conductance mechanosensitive channel
MNADLTTIAVGLYLGFALSQFFTAITRDLVTPLIAGVFPGVQQSVDKVVIQVGPVKLNVGDAIGAVMNLAIAFLVVSMTMPYVRAYAPMGGRR